LRRKNRRRVHTIVALTAVRLPMHIRKKRMNCWNVVVVLMLIVARPVTVMAETQTKRQSMYGTRTSSLAA
jgi:hypothetical protein